ncbi:MAG: hypothetical protein IJJ40_01020 [Clostridia bacterium]|nr:hypothetical protein [Clostridia bacterium]
MSDFISVNDVALLGHDDSETIQNAIEKAEKDGCRKIVIPRYNMRTDSTAWRIARTILIPSDFTVVLDNCYMVQETGVYANMFANSYAFDEDKRDIKYEQKNIKILGVGNVVLDGGKHNRLREKTTRQFGLPSIWLNNMMFWLNVNGLHIENINIEHQRYWAINHVFTRNVTLKNIHFYAIPHVNNLDGIDLRVGCNNFKIENITGRTGDDVVALTSLWGYSEKHNVINGKDGDIHDVSIKNIKADPNRLYCLRLLNHDGNKIYNIDVDTIMDTSDYVSKARSSSALGMGSPIYYKIRHMQEGELYNINVKNITTRSNNAVFFNWALENATISNLHVFGDGIDMFTPGKHNGPMSSCTFKNVKFEHLFYGANQNDMIGGKELSAEALKGTVFNFTDAKGEIEINDVHIDSVNRAFVVSGGVKVKVNGYKCNRAYKEFDISPDSEVIVDGEVK